MKPQQITKLIRRWIPACCLLAAIVLQVGELFLADLLQNGGTFMGVDAGANVQSDVCLPFSMVRLGTDT